MAIPASDWVTTTTILHDLRDAGNERAWTRFVERFREPLAAFARRSGLADSDADDAAQEALVEFSKGYVEGRYERGRGRLSSWLFGIAHHCVLRQRQRDSRAKAQGTHSEDTGAWSRLADEKTSGETWNTEWERWVWLQCLRRAREEFEPETIRAFLLIAERGLSPASVAESLGIPTKAVYNAKHRILRRLRELREELEGEEVK